MRKFPVGAEVSGDGVDFRVWAPQQRTVEVLIEERRHSLQAEENGYFSANIPSISHNTLYTLCLNGKPQGFPDPASRFQPLGPHGPSQIINPTLFEWSDTDWKGILDPSQMVLYELHIGTFTPEGTFRSALKKLPYLAELGISVIELMPIAEFCGRFNWGYDGVNLFAPTRNYGHPDDVRAFINQAHSLGIGVILDVVYNHFGPDGNYLAEFSKRYFKSGSTEWGEGINFDGEKSQAVREYFIANAGYWIEEFHFDGLRLDACQAIVDRSSPHIIADIVQEVRLRAKEKKSFVIAENEQQSIRLIHSLSEGGYGLDAVWNEDFHHSAYVRLTGRNEAYYSDYSGQVQEFISSAKYGFLYQGQWYEWQKKNRGTPCLDVAPHHFINFLENHDQVANSAGSLHLSHLSNPGAWRALTTLLMLLPQIPLLFQGQEFGSSAPFYYFGEQHPKLAQKIFQGRIKFISQFESFNNPEVTALIPPPFDETTFLKSKLNWEELTHQNVLFRLHKDLLFLRKSDPVFGHMKEVEVDGAVLGKEIFCLRYKSKQGERLLLFNLGIDLSLNSCAEPLLACTQGHRWELFWSSEKPCYGGFGFLPIPPKGNWRVSGNCALIFQPKKVEEYET